MTLLGGLLFGGGCLWLLVLLVLFCLGRGAQGVTWAVASVWTAAGLNLLGLGLIGEYLGKIYLETKARPRYLIETALLHEARQAGRPNP